MGGTGVYIGGLPYGVREKDLERFFKGYGRIRDILIKNGYGFVEFDDYRDADDAVYELNGKDLLGERVRVEMAHAAGGNRDRGGFRGDRGGGGGFRGDRRGGGGDRGKQDKAYGPPTRTEYRLVVENLSSRVSWQDLKDYMRQAGEVTYADAHKQRRNEGVVEFASYSDLKAAVEKLDDTELNGRRIRLVEDRGRSGGRGGGRRSRSSSRSRSKSRSRSRGRRDSRSKSKSKSRSKSRSKSPRSKSRSRSKSRGASRDKSKSPVKKEKAVSRSRSRSPRSRSKSRDKSRSRSRSESKGRGRSASRSRSKSVEKNGDRSGSGDDMKEDGDD